MRVSFNGQDRTLRTFRLRFDSSYPYQVFSTGRPIAQDTALRTLKLELESPLIAHFLLVMAEQRGCRLIGKDRWLSISGCGIVTRRPYQIFGL